VRRFRSSFPRIEDMHMTTVGNLGFPRIGAKRELKRALEAH